jgi:hypothetical protein
VAKTTAPLFGFGASGKLGNALVFGKWKGIDVARRYVIPANPNTSGQSTQRGKLTSAVAEWHDVTNPLSAADKEAWDRLAGVQATPRTGFNEFCKRAIDASIDYSAAFEHMFGITNIVTTASAFKADIDDSAGGTLTVTIHLGNTKTYFPVTATDAQVGGLTSFTAFNTTFAAGDTVYYWFDVPTGATYKRSGLYTALLT